MNLRGLRRRVIGAPFEDMIMVRLNELNTGPVFVWSTAKLLQTGILLESMCLRHQGNLPP